jgi:hypothetical protein
MTEAEALDILNKVLPMTADQRTMLEVAIDNKLFTGDLAPIEPKAEQAKAVLDFLALIAGWTTAT